MNMQLSSISNVNFFLILDEFIKHFDPPLVYLRNSELKIEEQPLELYKGSVELFLALAIWNFQIFNGVPQPFQIQARKFLLRCHHGFSIDSSIIFAPTCNYCATGNICRIVSIFYKTLSGRISKWYDIL